MDEVYNERYIFGNSYAALSSAGIHSATGLLGVRFMQYYDWLFDYTNVRKLQSSEIYYKPNTPLAERNYGFYSVLETLPELGIIHYDVYEKGLWISSMIKDSIAYKNGIVPPVTITAINGRPLEEYTLEEVLKADFYKSVRTFTYLKDDIPVTKEFVCY
jgi:hypothetical protein